MSNRTLLAAALALLGLGGLPRLAHAALNQQQMVDLLKAVDDRQKNNGDWRAIGMQRGSVLWMFMLESLMLGLFGTVVGAIAGSLIGTSIDRAHLPVAQGLQFILMSDHLRLAVHMPNVVKAVVFITCVTAAAALFPSRRASRLEPVVAMSHFG